MPPIGGPPHVFKKEAPSFNIHIWMYHIVLKHNLNQHFFFKKCMSPGDDVTRQSTMVVLYYPYQFIYKLKDLSVLISECHWSGARHDLLNSHL